MKFKSLLIGLGLMVNALPLMAQKNYFVDGFHGGVYGHYPMWVTSFMLDKLKAHPEWRIGIEIEPETWDTVRVKDPAGYHQLQNWVYDDRLDFTNPTYAQPYMYNISGESIIRQFSYGIAKLKDHFPHLQFHTYAVEEPCFTSSLPLILKQFGFSYAVLKCPNTLWGGYTRAHGGELLNWIGPEGTSILTVPRYESEALEENSTWQTTAWNNSMNFIESARKQGILNPIGMCYQDAGWKNGPWLGTGNQIKNQSTYLTWTEYFKTKAPKTTAENWQLSQEDLLVNLMWGSQVLQKIAQQVRQAENSLMMTEKIAAMAYLDQGYQIDQARLTEAWRTLMLAQHHDSWIVPYNKLHGEQPWAQAIKKWTAHAVDKSKKMIQSASAAAEKSNIKPENGLGFVRLYNTQGQERTEIVQIKVPLNHAAIQVLDAKGKLIPTIVDAGLDSTLLSFEATVAGMGYSTYRLTSEKSTLKKKSTVRFNEIGDCIIENDQFILILDKQHGGTIKSLKAKYLKNKEFIQATNKYAFNEVSGHFFQENRFHSSKESTVNFDILQDNPLEIRVAIIGEIAGHPMVQTISLKKGQKRIDMDLKIDWKQPVGIGEYQQKHNWTDNRRAFTDDRYKLKILFPTNLKQEQIYKNAPFDVTKSTLDSTFFGRWDDIKHNIILNWADVYDEQAQTGLAVLTDHTSSYVHGPDMPFALTAQYAGVGLWGMDYKITEALHMQYAVVPHQLTWDEAGISAQSNQWNEPLYGLYHPNLPLENKQFIQLQEQGFEVSSFQEEGNQIRIRFYNAEAKSMKQKIKINTTIKSLAEIQLDGKKVQDVPFQMKNNQVEFELTIPRYGFKTLTFTR